MISRDDALVAGIVDRLLAVTVPGDEITLDTIGEGVGTAPISYEQIGAVIDALERAGRAIAEPGIDVTHALKEVLSAARRAHQRGGPTPTVQELEQLTGLDRATILTALRFGDTLRR